MTTTPLAAFLRRAWRRADRAPVSRPQGVCPPALLPAGAAGWRASLRDWLDTGLGRAPQPAARRPAADAIGAVRAEFLESLADIRTQQAGMLAHRITIARSLHELWHLRPEVFKLVALRHSQFEAQARLDRLNRHFPTRAPRSGFGSFEPDAASRRPARQR